MTPTSDPARAEAEQAAQRVFETVKKALPTSWLGGAQKIWLTQGMAIEMQRVADAAYQRGLQRALEQALDSSDLGDCIIQLRYLKRLAEGDQ